LASLLLTELKPLHLPSLPPDPEPNLLPKSLRPQSLLHQSQQQ
jgi:hypothetical protein